MNNLPEITLHGYLGEKFGEKWSLNIKNVSEALRAIDTNTDGSFFRALIERDALGTKYKIIIDGKGFEHEEFEKTNDYNLLKNSDIFINKNIKTIDIVPCIQGAGGFGLIIGGLGLAGLGGYLNSAMLVFAGLGLALQGVSNLMATPPKFEEFREIQQVNKRQSYLFNGPQNSISEGGPVPLGYGRLIIGSQLIGYDLKIIDREITL